MPAMATSITGAERLPDADYTVSHRTPPVPSRHPYPSAPAPNSPPLPLNDTRSTHASEAGSVRSEQRRRGSFSFLRRSSSHNKASQEFRDSSEVPPVPTVPATRIAQAQQQATAQNGLQTSSNSSRKISGEGRTMLRKSSKMKQVSAAASLVVAMQGTRLTERRRSGRELKHKDLPASMLLHLYYHPIIRSQRSQPSAATTLVPTFQGPATHSQPCKTPRAHRRTLRRHQSREADPMASTCPTRWSAPKA